MDGAEVTADLLFGREEGSLAEAEQIYRRVLAIREAQHAQLSDTDSELARSMVLVEDAADRTMVEGRVRDAAVRAWSKLAHVLFKRGEYREAEAFFRKVCTPRSLPLLPLPATACFPLPVVHLGLAARLSYRSIVYRTNLRPAAWPY